MIGFELQQCLYHKPGAREQYFQNKLFVKKGTYAKKNVNAREKMCTHAKKCVRTRKNVYARKKMCTHAQKCVRTQKNLSARKKV